MNTRRQLVFALGACALAPLAAFAQAPGKVWRIGFLAYRHFDLVDTDVYYGSFTQGMRELGYFAGKNLVIEWRSAEGKIERLPDLAAELVRLLVDVLVAQSTPASRAAQKVTATLPIVMVSVGDPVGNGLVKSLARPGGNSTGLSIMAAELTPKLLEMLRSMVPKVIRVAILLNPANPSHHSALENIKAAAPKVGVTILPIEAGTPEEISNAFAAMARQNAGALVMPLEAIFVQQRKQIIELAAKHRLPSISGDTEYAAAGGLMGYGQNIRENNRRAAIYVDKILKGARAGDLPVEQPTHFDLAVNLKTAKALGIKVPQSILIQATKVIE